MKTTKSNLKIIFSIWLHIRAGNCRAVTMASSDLWCYVGKVDFGGCKWPFTLYTVIFARVLHIQGHIEIAIWLNHSMRAGRAIETASSEFPYDVCKIVFMWCKEQWLHVRFGWFWPIQFWKIKIRFDDMVGCVLRRRSRWRPQNCDPTLARSTLGGVSDFL